MYMYNTLYTLSSFSIHVHTLPSFSIYEYIYTYPPIFRRFLLIADSKDLILVSNSDISFSSSDICCLYKPVIKIYAL